jgi:hypothetical protein
MSAISRLFRFKSRLSAAATIAVALSATAAIPTLAHANSDEIRFDMSRSAAIVKAGCLAGAHGIVSIESFGPVEQMRVKVEGMPPNTDFDFFVIQAPNAPFGMSWYQGDIETNAKGVGYGTFVGRFNVETFIVAPGAVPAPSVFNNAFPDATLNPPTGPIHTYHLGLWFNSPADAAKAGCPATVTPFNGEHNAGIQVLNTSSFPELQGPLLQLKP